MLILAVTTHLNEEPKNTTWNNWASFPNLYISDEYFYVHLCRQNPPKPFPQFYYLVSQIKRHGTNFALITSSDELIKVFYKTNYFTKMKKSLLLLFCLSTSYFIMAQEPSKQKEIGLVFKNLDGFGLTYKTGNDKSVWRFNTLFINGSTNINTSLIGVNKHSSIGFGIAVGKEYRKEIFENLELRYGASLSFSYRKSESEYNDKATAALDRFEESTTYAPGIDLVFGFNYVFHDKFVLGAELLPGFSYIYGTNVQNRSDINFEERRSEISGFNYGLSNSSVLLSASYRF